CSKRRSRNSPRRKYRHERFANSKCRQRFLNIVKRSLRKGSRCGFECLVVIRRKRAERVLNTVTELSENVFVDVLRTLGNKENTDPLGSDQSNYLLDLVEQCFARAVEDEMCLIEEENKLRLIDVAYFRKLMIESREHPQHERTEQG